MGERKIGDRWFKAGDALATDAIRLQVRLIKLLGPAIDRLPEIFGSFAPGVTEAGAIAANTAAIGALVSIASAVEPDDMVSLVQDVCTLGMISYTGKGDWSSIDVDLEFSGQNARDLFPVVAFILAETLGDFFSGFLASGRQPNRAKVSPSAK